VSVGGEHGDEAAIAVKFSLPESGWTYDDAGCIPVVSFRPLAELYSEHAPGNPCAIKIAGGRGD
jgi:hypothetical protein